MIRTLTAALGAALFMAASVASGAAHAASICVYDPAGKSGDYYRLVNDYALAASGWGTPVEVKTYTDEETAKNDYAAGKCDGVVATGVRLQGFNNFPSTIEAIGGLPEYALLRQLSAAFVKYPSAAARLRKGDHETVGIIPVGAVYLFVRDRNIDSVGELAGKRIATLDYDKPSLHMVKRVGAIVVGADLGSLGPKFNNGDVDACYVPAPAFEPFELHRGLGTKGGILKAPLAQGTLQVMIRPAQFADGFGAKSRAWWHQNFDKALAIVQRAEAAIPAHLWVPVSATTTAEWDELFLNTRVELKGTGAYDGNMLSTMKKLRCAKTPGRSECAENRE